MVPAQNRNEKRYGAISVITNKNGQALGFSTISGIAILTVDGFDCKGRNKNGKFDKFEDWRLTATIRAKDLAAQMSVAQIAGLMLYNRHQPIPNPPGSVFAGTYNCKPFCESGANAADHTDQQNCGKGLPAI